MTAFGLYHSYVIIWMLQTETSHLWKVRYAIILLGWWYELMCPNPNGGHLLSDAYILFQGKLKSKCSSIFAMLVHFIASPILICYHLLPFNIHSTYILYTNVYCKWFPFFGSIAKINVQYLGSWVPIPQFGAKFMWYCLYFF